MLFLFGPYQIIGGLYNPGDGHTDPYSLTQAFAAGARMYGAAIYLQTEITGTKQRSDGGWDVTTTEGTIKAKRVINCGGTGNTFCKLIIANILQ